jgi:hypothetical protein
MREPPDCQFDVYRTRRGRLVLTVKPLFKERDLSEDGPVMYWWKHDSLKGLSKEPFLDCADRADRARFVNDLAETLRDDFMTWID